MLDGDDEEESEMSEQVAERLEIGAPRRVRVWFGQHIVAEYVADPEHAAAYARAMARRFAGLKVTNEPLRKQPPGRPLPSERLWDNPPN